MDGWIFFPVKTLRHVGAQFQKSFLTGSQLSSRSIETKCRYYCQSHWYIHFTGEKCFCLRSLLFHLCLYHVLLWLQRFEYLKMATYTLQQESHASTVKWRKLLTCFEIKWHKTFAKMTVNKVNSDISMGGPGVSWKSCEGMRQQGYCSEGDLWWSLVCCYSKDNSSFVCLPQSHSTRHTATV